MITMTSGPPVDVSREYASHERRRTTALPNRFEEPLARQYAIHQLHQNHAYVIDNTQTKIAKDGARRPVGLAAIVEVQHRFL